MDDALDDIFTIRKTIRNVNQDEFEKQTSLTLTFNVFTIIHPLLYFYCTQELIVRWISREANVLMVHVNTMVYVRTSGMEASSATAVSGLMVLGVR